MNGSDKALAILVLGSLVILGFLSMFNLLYSIIPIEMLNLSFTGRTGIVDVMWTIILRLVVAPLLIIVPSWVIYNLMKL